MPLLEATAFAFAYQKSLPAVAATRVWQRWSAFSSWQDWDRSLSGTQAESETLALGQRFCVVPRVTGHPVPVTITSIVERLHFTTVSAGPMGLIAFGHTLILDAASPTATLEHSVCAVPTDQDVFRAMHWDRLMSDVAGSVESLSDLVVMGPAA